MLTASFTCGYFTFLGPVKHLIVALQENMEFWWFLNNDICVPDISILKYLNAPNVSILFSCDLEDT